MERISIPQLTRAPNRTLEISFAEFLPGFATLTPVRGQLTVSHGGNYLQVALTAETIVSLTCGRCLQLYNYRLAIDTAEMLWLTAQPTTPSTETEITPENLVESLPINGSFDPGAWLYEQACLALPLVCRCQTDCPGIQVGAAVETPLDQRWAALRSLYPPES